MKKFLVIAFVTLILINISIAQEYKANEAFIQFNASGYILLSGNFQMLNLTVRFVPQNYHSIVHNGNLSIDKYNNTVFTKIYNHPKNRVDWWINSTIFLNKTFAKLNRSYPFPYTNYPKEIERYLEWEYDEEVAKTASEIVQGAIDYYDAILRLFNWIRKNIKYDESLIYVSSVNTSPAYVLKSRKALCSGFSSLFVAFLRSVGIPARNVFGIAHSGKEMREHMWVDIYIPENGFVEFDPTYGQFGYVDASHIRLYADNTSNAVETVYSYEGNASILYSNYSFSYELINYSSSFDALESKAYLSKEIAACDDNVLLILEIKNPLNSYVLTSAMITKVKDLELVYGDEYSSVVIPPLSSKQIHYVFHTQKNLKPNALYINPILIFVFGAREINLNLTINPKITERTRLDEIIITQENVSIEKNILRADILISPNKTAFPTNIFLKLKNVGNTILKNVGLKINYSNISYNYDLGMFLITQEKEFKYQLEIPNETGSYKVNVYLEYANKTDHYESILIVKEKTLIDYLIYFINKVISKLLEFLGRKAY